MTQNKGRIKAYKFHKKGFTKQNRCCRKPNKLLPTEPINKANTKIFKKKPHLPNIT